MRYLLLPLCILCSEISADTLVYQWIDDNGVRHYSQWPRSDDSDYGTIRIRVAQPAPVPGRTSLRRRTPPRVKHKRAPTREQTKGCAQYAARIRTIRAHRRAGYTAAEGVRLKRRLRKYEALRREHCS